MDRFTTPPPYSNLYDAETPPSAQPCTPLFDISEFIDFPPSSPVPFSQQTTQDVPPSQQTTQSWDSRNGPRSPSLRLIPSSPLPIPESLLEPGPAPSAFIPDSQASSSQVSSSRPRSLHPHNYISYIKCSRNKRLQIQIALLFKIPSSQIKETLDVIDRQIWYAKSHYMTPQKKSKAGRHAKLHIPEKIILKD
jgi:hypothetical protein